MGIRTQLGTKRIALAGALAAAGLLVVAPQGLAGQPAPSGPSAQHAERAPVGKDLNLLQVNLCRSGKAGCWMDGDVHDTGSSLHSLVRQVDALKKRGDVPDVITIEEGCSKDIGITSEVTGTVLYELKNKVGLDYQRAWQAEGDTSGGGEPVKYQCVHPGEGNSPERGTFGVGILSLKERVGAKGEVTRGLYPKSMQRNVTERRAYMCADYEGKTRPDPVSACVSHLSLASDPDDEDQSETYNQKQQCRYLQGQLAHREKTTVFGGDLNMKYAGTPNDAQNCVPRGFTRKGDGDVQHIMASNELDFPEKLEQGDLPGTDHDWLLAKFT